MRKLVTLGWMLLLVAHTSFAEKKIVAPAGTAHASVGDWARFARAHLRGALGLDGLLASTTARALHADPQRQGYAAGWVVRGEGAERVLEHDGSNGTWYATVRVEPGRRRAVVVAANAGGGAAARACEQAAAALLRLPADGR